ncbi:MAG TPA: hypothetical protein VMI31_17350, partial [Fimbriimonadaceae bacterium]|nr:hypothetical protein [Fimbriimonadaceae bacterium]
MLVLAAVIQASLFSLQSASSDSYSISWDGRTVFTAHGPAPTDKVTVEPAQALYLGYPHGPNTADF